ncbi:PilC/PilY family type IV pilus protein [Desulfobulbus sp.]|uniref:pilus assembly protein n=1 Tax=Desulfobulbus sp. TaxID=895 RepID=UPI00286F59F2|nr:PilC/PilY family type IV pilus protein [Desulfobulbus sp.]
MKTARILLQTMAALGLAAAGLLPVWSLAEVTNSTNSNFASVPMNLTSNDATPLVMLNMSRDHQLHYKAYTDYADLNGDGVPETTYTDNIEYYGYFDTKKCYDYSTGNNRFVPATLATGTNSHYCSGKWSGNFLNWASMTRMDVVRKLLYGGKRSTDTSTLTVLERQFLPMDAHAFAKYYDGSDVSDLTPFTNINLTPAVGSGKTVTTSNNITKETPLAVPNNAAANIKFKTSTLALQIGDQVKMEAACGWMIGGVSTIESTGITIAVPKGSSARNTSQSCLDWTVTNLSQTGISFCNLTTSTGGNLSQTNTGPPLLRVAKGNYALWNANEGKQCYWYDENKVPVNGNQAAFSGINASSANPSRSYGLGTGSAQGEYIVRVEVGKAGLFGEEKLKKYGTSTYKPIGLLQTYGDTDQLRFGLMTGSYSRNVSGGVLRKNVSSFTNEVNPNDGTFVANAKGIVHNLDRLRMNNYNYSSGNYLSNDFCNYQQVGFEIPKEKDVNYSTSEQGTLAQQGKCSSWGNPMSEIYLESLRYLAGKKENAEDKDLNGRDWAYSYKNLLNSARDRDSPLGLTLATWEDPLSSANYCAPINVINFNASVSGYDDDQMSKSSEISPSQTVQALTNAVGVGESLNAAGAQWFIGSNGTTTDSLCSGKPIGAGFGAFAGLCPEAPTQKGTYLMAGLAYYANTHRIRNDLPIHPSRQNSRDLMVNTFGVALATNVPKIEVNVNGKKVTILPAYRLDRSSAGNGPFGGGTLVDFKIIEQTPTYGKYYANWEDSEMGGDYDQDMWGIIEYTVDLDTNEVTVTTAAIAESTGAGQGFGYVISGTNKDGAHFHSGIELFDFTYTLPNGTKEVECTNCQVGAAPTSRTYKATGSSAGLLNDPLWYAAKWGGFIDSNNDGIPQPEEWDKTNNRTGEPGSDGLPDNYFYASNPLQLENSLNRVFLDILKRASSGTAAAVVSNNVNGVGALYQAFYEPARQDSNDHKVEWIGTVQALWMDSYGYMREDNGDGKLDGYLTDPRVEFFYDDSANRTKIKRFVSTKDDKYTPHYMQGKVTAYNDVSGSLTFTVEEMSGTAGNVFGNWTVYNLSNGKIDTSASLATMGNATVTTVTVTPAMSWFNVGDTIRIAHDEFVLDALENLHTLWNARKRLSQIVTPETQRAFADPASSGRFIKTWIDTNGNNVVDSGEFVSFERGTWGNAVYGYFDLATTADVNNVIDYIRGKEISGFRNRTIDYDGDGLTEVIRLGDIVNSTPTVASPPQGGNDLLYKDTSYAVFKNKYAKRRQVIYAGSNDGLLHAFNGGFYDSSTNSYLINGTDHKGIAATAHPLGSEIWAYAPMNLLPHLKWLTKADYQHVYYVDGKPKLFDAKIFTNDDDHPEGWGTVLVVGMRFGGGPITVDTKADGLAADPTPEDNREFRSAYIVMDVTNPEAEPRLLGEIQVPDRTYSTSYPAVFMIKDKNVAYDANKWFLAFGSGPNDLHLAKNSNSAKLFIFDLGELAQPGSSDNGTLPTDCARVPVAAGSSMYILSCDTKVPASLTGDPVAVDWNLDYKADSIYFGTAGDAMATSGRLMRMDINNQSMSSNWSAPTTLIETSQPVLVPPLASLDSAKQKWVFFGTGRFFVSADQSSTATQSIYGVIDKGTPVQKNNLLNVSNAQVGTDGSVSGVDAISAFKTLEEANKGWYVDLPPIQGIAGTVPSTRVMTPQVLAGGVLFTTAYQPSLDECTGEGSSRLYGLYYRTGTAHPSAILGTIIVNGKEVARSFVELGPGFASMPSLHSGAEATGNAVSIFTQQSTGTIGRNEGKTVYNLRSGMEAWKEN